MHYISWHNMQNDTKIFQEQFIHIFFCTGTLILYFKGKKQNVIKRKDEKQ